MNQNYCWWQLTSYVRWAVAAAGLIYVVGARAEAPTAEKAHPAWDLEKYLDYVSESNPMLKAARLQKDAATLKKNQGDLQELSPFLSVEGGYLNDSQETTFPSQQGTRTVAKSYSLGISKKFSTGTTLSAQWGQAHSDIEGLAFPFVPAWDSRYTLAVSQSLWKDGFGRGVRLRHEREEASARVNVLTAELQARQALVDAESVFWDMAVQILDRQQKADALKRAEKIRVWTLRRLNNGIGDRADRLQVESLLASRRVAQINSDDAFASAKQRALDTLGLPEIDLAGFKPEILSKERSLSSGEGDPRRLDIWIQHYAAKIGESAARETNEMLRPDLSLTGAFGANARDSGIGTSSSDALKSDTSVYRVGVKLALSLDFGLKRDLRAAANAEATAARLKSDKLSRDGSSSWSELVRRHKELGASIVAMEALVKAQESQLAREQERLAVGRTTTFQVISFEQSVADSHLALLQLRAGQRKLEAASRLYLNQNAVEAL